MAEEPGRNGLHDGAGSLDPAVRLARRLRDQGLRMTPQRLAVYRCLQAFAARHHHPTVEEVWRALEGELPQASAATVRRTLDLLVELGLARRVIFPGEAEHFDGDPHLHVHLHCRQCGRVEDVSVPQLNGLEDEIAERTGFVLTGQSLVFTGLCPACQQEAAPRWRAAGGEG
ncbi:MAG TPA: Fur family transcriptional regulator [Thermaerobacter sp.]